MALIETILQDFEREADATRGVLERVSDVDLSWRPHPDARTIGELAQHVAQLPRGVAELMANASAAGDRRQHTARPDSTAELLATLERSIVSAQQVLSRMDDAALLTAWRLMQGDVELFALPHGALLRSLLLNRWGEQRGQLAVYLRQRGVHALSGAASLDATLFG